MRGLIKANSTSQLPYTFCQTDIAPAVAPTGTVATIWVSLQLIIVAVVLLLKNTLPGPWVAWNPEPVTVICVPAVPTLGVTLLTCGGGTEKLIFETLLMPPTLTTTTPLVAVEGTVAVIEVLDHAVAVAATLLKVIVLLP